MNGPPRVFVSYSHEEQDHDAWVSALATKLRENGVDASLDRWDLKPGGDMTLFMESQIRDSDFVIMVCTPLYREKSNVPRGGVGYEKNIISAEMLQVSDLRPKFLPVLRKGNHEEALPTYLGSKYAIDFRDDATFNGSMAELLRAIFGQPHPQKPPLGRSPFSQDKSPGDREASALVGQDVSTWQKEALGRFSHLRTERIVSGPDPFLRGFWQACFTLHDVPPSMDLIEFLKRLKAAKTGRTGWDVGWVPTRKPIAPYPFRDGIEVWLAESGGKAPGHSDYWRAEPSGRFSLFRGYQEDQPLEPGTKSGAFLDYGLVLWRIAEVLLYLESFATRMEVPQSAASLVVSWKGLQDRVIAHHDPMTSFFTLHEEHVSHQDSVEVIRSISRSDEIKPNLITSIHAITAPLFEAFDFFSVTEANIKQLIKRLFDLDRELPLERSD